ncbi:uncharacterized protein [Anoplolepis gracilipes]|uniref:uncharacterized protein n=1 Tax=Anoplolepis gracilipes TaxID=354296 RepID=UPI003B9EF98A
MENRYALFHVALVLNVLILVVSFTGVISAPVMPSITEVMKNDTKLCKTSKFLYDLEYTKLCASLLYPSGSLNVNENTLDTFLCLGVYDTAYKICQYSSQFPHQTSSFNAAVLTQYMEEFVPNEDEAQEKEFCKNLQGYTSSYNKIDSLLTPLIEAFNHSHKCQKICFDLVDQVKPLCAIFAWIKKFDDKKVERTETKYDFVTSAKLLVTQSNEVASNNKIIAEAKKTEEKETNEQDKIITNSKNDNTEETNLNVPENMPTTVHVQPDVEKVKSDSEKLSKTKKPDDTFSETQTYKSASPILQENKKINNIKTEDNVKIEKPLSINNPVYDVPKKDVINEEKKDEFNKEQNNDDLKPSTLSENTQDQYAGNPEEDIETNVADSNIDDVDDTIQQSTRNQNGNVQEVFEQKDLRYPNIRTDDDSHFFTYFTVVTVACIAGYIGYHNKQKILAIVLEGRRSRSNRSRRRPSTANYRKLDCTLEEAVTSQCNANVTHVIY